MNFGTACLLALIVSIESASLFQTESLSKPKTVKVEFRMMDDRNGGLKLLPVNVENSGDDIESKERSLEFLPSSFELPERFESVSQVEQDVLKNSINELGETTSAHFNDGANSDMSDKSYMAPNIEMYQ
ncbi:hypothetical protein BpHYR1_009855 [Brachionus plicatilis]|uniref:Uncharacterized protein n=1 Tax=Brachionus plicatilis TaxID=10195 RepID=A0A3M7SE80_BRAPC|nr:hypothetical protein BpHYR1_009855 [Brachionus plicatilis]